LLILTTFMVNPFLANAVRKAIAKKGLTIKVVKISKFGEDELNSSSEIKRKIIEEYRRHS